MEEKIGKILDNLTVEQTDKLLDENMEMKINGREINRIKNEVLKKIGSKKKKGIYIPKKLMACAVALIIIFTSFSIVGFDNVAAFIGNMFTFIPGVGISEKSETAIYTIDPIVRQTDSQEAKANIVSAIYSDGYLSVTVEVTGRDVYYEDFSMYINHNKINSGKDMYSLARSSASAMLNWSYETKAPKDDNIYEISVAGFQERLSFKMIPCSDYDDIKKIGPTDIQNGISITTTAQRVDNELIVWCYPFNAENTSKDKIFGYGIPSNASFNQERYIETESGQIFNRTSGWQLNGRIVFDMPENDKTATLHIPYLAMFRNEKKKLKVTVPKDYTTVESDVSVDCSRGKIKVTEIKRKPNEYEKDKDTVWLKFDFESNDNNMALYSFEFDPSGKYSSNAKHFNPENGCMEYLEIYVGKNENKISLNITNLYYYLFDEYVIPLDIK